MVLKRLYDEGLAQASFLVGCEKAGEAIVIDPNRDVEQYLRLAEDEGLRIVGVTETHIHADFVSGSRELAKRTEARLYLSDEGDEDWKYGYAAEPNVTLVREGGDIRAGAVRLDVLKTPGHTPEHIAFLLTDEAASASPMAAFTGDFIFIGDVGRPDLLERAAGFEGTMEAGARTLYRSLAKFKTLSDSLMLWPSHGAGSACGKNLSSLPVSSLGYEKSTNWALRCETEEAFAAEVLAGQPEPPSYFKEMKRLNKMGPPILGGFRTPERLKPSRLAELLAGSQTVIDARAVDEVASGFVLGTLAISLKESFTTWAGWLAPYDQPSYLIAQDEAEAGLAAKRMALIGLDDVEGWFAPDAIEEARKEGLVETIEQVNASDAYGRFAKREAEILDVRGAGEFTEGHIPGASHIPLGYLAGRRAEVPSGKPVILHCRGGSRSVTAYTLLRKLGHPALVNMTDGFWEYELLGLPIETGHVRARA
ncbi:MAG: MBL fold metallo-hydrolase [Fimbriimonas ginsengisoli]|uniref:MBL fold metallo-hydrolase n=1 Tax=Fimbriimonas ginsengisoli TaxID=1005039 RepID=A0A931PW70_FIMGI|nr:MBL fold metallo-hydrolase [Fimbriimonas ginsengisoli]